MVLANRLKFLQKIFIRSISQTTTDESLKVSPLKGIRILDLTRIIAGPYATMVLSDLGADVIKIEQPNMGDEARKFGPPFLNNSNDSVYFMSINRNKRSVCIDFKKGSDLIVELAKKCDVLIENYVPGKLDKYGLSYEKMKEQCPSLIYCSVTGYGSVGPYAQRPGYDVIAASYGGLLHITGPENGDPCKVGIAITDICTGLYAHGAILAALMARNQTGKGTKIDANLLSTQLSCLINLGSSYLIAGIDSKRQGTAHGSIVPYQTFRTKNGHLCVGTGSDKQFQVLCDLLEMPEIADDPKFITNKTRVENRQEIIEILSKIFAKETNEWWLEKFEKAPFPVGPVNSIKEAFTDRHVQEIGIVKTVQHSEAGEIKVVGPPVMFDNLENSVKSAPPVLGQHTDEVLKEYLKYDKMKIDKLRCDGVIS